MRSFMFTALCLSLVHTSYARVAPLVERNADARPDKLVGAKRWADRLLGRDTLRPRADNATCYEDVYFRFAASNIGPNFCRYFMDYPNVTETVDYTPTRYFPKAPLV